MPLSICTPEIDHEIGDRLYPYANHDEIAFDATISARHHALHAICSLKGRHRFLKEHQHAVFMVESFEDAPDLLAQHAVQRRFERLDHRDFYSVMAQRGCNLGADEPHADQHSAATAPAPRTDAVGIVYRAKVVDTL